MNPEQAMQLQMPMGAPAPQQTMPQPQQMPGQMPFPANDMQPQHPQLPQPLHLDANQSVGLSTADRGDEQGGLPGHRLYQFVESWGGSKTSERQNQDEADSFYDLKVWDDEAQEALKERHQSPSNVPLCHLKINAYIGITHRLRRDPKAHPRTFSKGNKADAATGALRFVDEITFGKTRFSEAGKDFFTAGTGAIYQGVKITDKGVDFVKAWIPRTNFLYDPRSVKADFCDAKFLGEWNWLDVDDAAEMLESLGRRDSAAKVHKLQEGEVFNGIAFPFMAHTQETWWDSERKRIRLVKLYYRYKNVWRCAILCGKESLYDQASMYRDEQGLTYQPYNAHSCYVDSLNGERYGAMKLMIPLQREINYRHSKLAWLVAAQQTMYEEGAVDDINDFKAEIRKPNGVIKVNPGALKDKRVEARQLSNEIEGQFKLLAHAEERLMAIGPNPALLGKGEGVNSQSGRAILALQNAGMAEMATVFDRHREFKLAAYRRDWLLIKQFWKHEPNKIVRILDDEEQAQELVLNQPVGMDMYTGQPIYENAISEMDVDWVLDEGTETTVIKEEMMQFISQAGNMPLPRLKTLIYLSGIPNHKHLFKLLDEENPKPNPEADELQKKIAYLEGMLKAAEVDNKIAATEKTRVDALAAMAQSGLGSEMLQAFPLDYGVRSTVEDFLDQDIHPFGNAFSFQPPPVMEPMPMQDGPMQSGPEGKPMPGPQQPAQMMQKPSPQLVSRETPPNMPGEMPTMGAEGGLPLPPDPAAEGLMPPAGTRV